MIKLKIELDPNNQDHMKALAAFAGALNGKTLVVDNLPTPDIIDVPKKKATKKTESTPVAEHKELNTPEVQKVETPTPEVQKAETPAADKERLASLLQKTGNLAVTGHKDVIKKWLTDNGAPKVSELDPAKYDEYEAFLNTLK